MRTRLLSNIWPLLSSSVFAGRRSAMVVKVIEMNGKISFFEFTYLVVDVEYLLLFPLFHPVLRVVALRNHRLSRNDLLIFRYWGLESEAVDDGVVLENVPQVGEPPRRHFGAVKYGVDCAEDHREPDVVEVTVFIVANVP